MNSKISLLTIITLIFTIAACAPTKPGEADNEKVFAQGYEDMKNTVQQAISSAKLNIELSDERNGKLTMVVNKKVYYENQSIQKDQGKVIVQDLKDGNTLVRVINPEYHYSVPEDDRADYKRILFNRIEDILY